jgi:phage terminase small subunit
MDNEILPEARIKQAREYILNKAKGLSKYDSAIEAGYSHNTARIPKVLEGRRSYAVALQQILDDNTNVIESILTSVSKDIESNKLDALDMKEKVDIYKKMAEVHKILTPQVTIKEEQLKDGTTKRTVWGTTGNTGE